MSVGDFQFAKSIATKPMKATVVGPMTAMDRLEDEFYHDKLAATLALATALNEEIVALEQAGASVIQIDGPILHAKFEGLFIYAPLVFDQLLQGVTAPVIVHVCYGYAYNAAKKAASTRYGNVLEFLAQQDMINAISIEYEQPKHAADILKALGNKHVVLGLLNLGSEMCEGPDHIASRLDEAAKVIPAERLHPAPDCGMWHLPQPVAFDKIQALCRGPHLFAGAHLDSDT